MSDPQTTEITRSRARLEMAKNMRILSNDLRSHNCSSEGALSYIALALAVLLEELPQ